MILDKIQEELIFYFLKFIYLFIYLFIYGCVGSSFLCEGFLQLRQAGATLHRGAWAFHCRGLSCCGAQAPDAQAKQLWLTGLVALRYVGSSQTRTRTRVPRIGRQILNHCATREAPRKSYLNTQLTLLNLEEILQDPNTRSRQESSLLKQRIKTERVAALRDTRNLSLGFHQTNQEQETSPTSAAGGCLGMRPHSNSCLVKQRLSGGRCPHSHLPRAVVVYAHFLCIITNNTRFPLRNTQAWTMNDTVSLLKGYLVKGWARKEKKHPASERDREREREKERC